MKEIETILRPHGGGWLKNCLGWMLIKAGSARTGKKQVGLSEIDTRVPIPEGVQEDHYNDSFVFKGSDTKGNLIMTRLGYRGGGKNCEVWLWMSLEGKKYVIPVDYLAVDPTEQQSLSAGGLTYTCIDREKGEWRIQYKGKINPGNKPCELDCVYRPVSSMYHSGMHMDAMTFAKSIAEMKWSREFFHNLRSESQTRIEQGGTLIGSVRIGSSSHAVDMLSIRDHSWGKRKWTFINRYIWNVICLTEELVIKGKSYRYLVFTTVKYGTTFEHLTSGWIAGEDSVLPIVASSDMAFLGDDGTIPSVFSCYFQPKGSVPLEMKVRRSSIEHSWYMQEKKFEVCEAWCSVDVEGVSGAGMSEFGYNLTEGYNREGSNGQ